MAEFNTHGGYFAPAGYMRINAGGSHEENPNGGVQVGVDQQGVPNMVEEGEPIYQDFVFSDNITAQEKFLVEAGLPKNFAGKFYSEICDSLFSEAEERPNDPISKNGLDAMLGRLAEAQEAQKAAEEEAALMEELKNMSPEELAAIEQMMAQEAQAQEQPMEVGAPMEEELGVAPEEAMMPEEQMPVETAQPVMALGGPMNSFAMGGDEDDPPYQPPLFFNPETGSAYVAGHAYAPVGEMNPAVVTAYGPNPVRDAIYEGQESFLRGAADVGQDIAALIPETAPFFAARDAYRSYRDFNEGDVWGGIKNGALSAFNLGFLFPIGISAKVKEAKALLNELGSSASKELRMAVEGLEKWMPELEKVKKVDRGLFAGSGSVAKQNVNSYSKMLNDAMKAYNGKGNGVNTSGLKEGLSKVGSALKSPTAKKVAVGGLTTLGTAGTIISSVLGDSYGDPEVSGNSYGLVEVDPNDFGTGGVVNRYDWGDFIRRLNDYSVSRNPGRTSGKYKIDTQFPLGNFKDIQALENDPGYQAFTDYVINNSNNPDVLAYLHALDNGTYANVPKLFTGDTLNKGWEKLYRRRRTDGFGGIYHFYDPDFDYTALSESGVTPELLAKYGSDPRAYNASFGRIPIEPGYIRGLGQGIAGLNGKMYIQDAPGRQPVGYSEWAGDRFTATAPSATDNGVDLSERYGAAGTIRRLPTWPRYAGAVGSGLLALNTLLQDPDHYDNVPINPVLPSGRILLQDERYMPMDQNMLTNQIQANNAANARALLNSGAGPSTGALIASADYTGGLNLGNAMTNVWQANNQERNRVIAANNQNAATRAQFYRDLDSQRAQILNNMAMYNNQNALRIAMLNNQAEQDKYNAFSQNLGNSLQALSGIGQENFAMNQINSNSALGYYAGPDGWNGYKGPNYVNPYWSMYDPLGFIRKYRRVEKEEE